MSFYINCYPLSLNKFDMSSVTHETFLRYFILKDTEHSELITLNGINPKRRN